MLPVPAAPPQSGTLPAAKRARPDPGDQRVVVGGVSYARYVALRELLDEHAGLRMTYLEGTLEIMTPSATHETDKKRLARLLEVYALDRDIDLVGIGSTTFRAEAARRGLEPDECYYLGDDGRDFPDFAIEIVTSSWAIDKLEVYRGLGVSEVWIYESGTELDRLSVHQLRDGAYHRAERSRFLPDLDLALLVEMMSPGLKQNEAIRLFRERSRG